MQEMPKWQIEKTISCAEGGNNNACDEDGFMTAFADIPALTKRGGQRI